MEKPSQRVVEDLASVYANRKWVLAAQVAVVTGGMIKTLSDWGSEVLVVAGNEGTGEVPDARVVFTRSEGDTIVGAIREFFSSVEHPAPEVQSEVDDFDGDHSARVLAEPFATAQRLLDRPTYGVRRPEWAAWEDKMRVDQLWDDLEVPRAPYRIVDLRHASEVASGMATELGTVWVADNSEGWHGGVEMVRWVRDEAAASEAVSFYEGRTDRVRIMPFLDGLPCSIHGWVTSTGVAVFLPVEIHILRHEGGAGFKYAGVSTNWVPETSVSDEMRAVARLVGEELGQRDGYRGPYGIDGVLTDEGFRPTELNPRMSAGAGVQLGSVDVPLGLMMRAEAEGDVEVDPVWLERVALEQRKSVVHAGKMVNVHVRDKIHLDRDPNGALVEVEKEEGSFATVTVGPAAFGSYVTTSLDTDRVDTGVSTAPIVAEVLNLASQKWDLGIPDLSPAPDLPR